MHFDFNIYLHHVECIILVQIIAIRSNDMPVHYLHLHKANKFWKYWFKWWTNISELDISNFDHHEECVLFGFPDENKIFNVINFCILIAKYYIYSKINQQ